MASVRQLELKLAVMVAVLALLAVACAGGSNGPADTSDSGRTSSPATGSNTDASLGVATIEPTNGFDGETIKLGYLTAQTGGLAFLGSALASGSQVYWDWLNSTGGIAGKYKVELEIADTRDVPTTAVLEYQRLKDDVVMFAQVLSTPPTQALLEFLKEDNIVAVPGSLVGAWANELLLLPNGAAYEYEMINLADWFVNDSELASGADVYCAIYVDDKYGQDALKGVEYAMEQLGLELADRRTMSRTTTNFTSQIVSFQDKGCTVVYTVSLPGQQQAILAHAKSVGFEPYWLAALPSFSNFFAATTPENYRKFYIAIDAPALVLEPDENTVPGMVKFLERFEAHSRNTTPTTFHLSGYFQSYAVHALLEKAVELGDLSREGMVAAMAQLSEVDVEGLTAENYVYGLPENRDPTSAVRIFQFDATAEPGLLREVDLVDSKLNESYQLY